MQDEDIRLTQIDEELKAIIAYIDGVSSVLVSVMKREEEAHGTT